VRELNIPCEVGAGGFSACSPVANVKILKIPCGGRGGLSGAMFSLYASDTDVERPRATIARLLLPNDASFRSVINHSDSVGVEDSSSAASLILRLWTTGLNGIAGVLRGKLVISSPAFP
jgi:hypothetical protein